MEKNLLKMLKKSMVAVLVFALLVTSNISVFASIPVIPQEVTTQAYYKVHYVNEETGEPAHYSITKIDFVGNTVTENAIDIIG